MASKVSEATVYFCSSTGQEFTEMRILSGRDAEIWILDPEEIKTFCEERVQLLEGCRYEYELRVLQPEWHLAEDKRLIRPSKITKKGFQSGLLETGTYSGLLRFELLGGEGEKLAFADVEVRSTKLNYRQDYRNMLDEIAERCLDILLDTTAPTAIRLTKDLTSDTSSLLQKLAFLRCIVLSEWFNDAIFRIVHHPHELLVQETEQRRLANARGRFNFSRSGNKHRQGLPSGHPLSKRLESFESPSIPKYIDQNVFIQTFDTAENRFVSHVLRDFLSVTGVIKSHLQSKANNRRALAEIIEVESRLLEALSHEVFRDLSALSHIPLSSSVLQQKAGYREVLKSWLMFEAASSLSWHGGEELHSSGQLNLATLYEYWVFIKLTQGLSKLLHFKVPLVEQLFTRDTDGFSLRLKKGLVINIEGSTGNEDKQVSVALAYNRTFSFSSDESQASSWTRPMRPDNTVSIWPTKLSKVQAEKAGSMVHLHFDAKYALQSLEQIFGGWDELLTEAETANPKIYKRTDVLKMHAYKDAIRRSQGAYVIYPGDKNENWPEYTELIPGLGAFVLRPGRNLDESLIIEFIGKVIEHIEHRDSLSSIE